MSDLELRPLTRAHAARMHAINRSCPIEADFRFYFDREPEFFRWPESVFDEFVYIGGFRGDELVAYALFATVAGNVAPLAARFSYVGDARVMPGERGRAFPQKATRALLAVMPPEAIAFAVVKRGNVAARAAMGKVTVAGMRSAHLCGYDAANVLLLRPTGGPRRFRVRRAGDDDLPRIAALMQRAYEGRLFAPFVTTEELRADIARLPGFDVGSYWLAYAGDELVGSLGAWDAGSVRRATVLRLSPRARIARAAYEAGRVLFPSAAAMPGAGGSFRTVTATRVAVPRDDPEVLRDLIAAVHDDLLGRGYHMLTVGFAGDDPLARAVRGMRALHFRSEISICGPDSNVDAVLGTRRPYVDLRFV